jgi:NhaA family Na+:H+ antiporter
MKLKVPYLIGGVIMWWFMLHSGIHATVTELLCFVIPFGNGIKIYLIYFSIFLHKPVGFYTPALRTITGIYQFKYWKLLLHYSIGIALG